MLFPATGIALLLMTTPLWGQDKPINLQSAISAALNNYGELNALREERGMNEAAITKAELHPNPVFEAGGSSGILTGANHENSLYINISQEFITGGKREKRSRIAQKELDSFDSRIIDAERLLKLKVKMVYYDLLLANKLYHLAQTVNERNLRLLGITEERLANGEVAELDVNLVKVETSRSEGRKIDAEQEMTSAQQQLLLLIGSQPDVNLKPNDSLDAGVFEKELIDLKKLAIENRPSLKALKSEAESAKMEVLLAKAERRPNVTAGLSYSRENSLTSLDGMEEKSTDNLIGLKVSIPLPVFDTNQGGVIQANSRKNSTQSRYIFALKIIEQEVEMAHTRLTSAKKAIELYRAGILPQLEQNLTIIEDAYQLGEVGIIAPIEEQKKFLDVSEKYLMALYNWNTAVAKVEAATGLELKKEYGEN